MRVKYGRKGSAQSKRRDLRPFASIGFVFASLAAMALGGCNWLDRLIAVEAPSRVVGDELEVPGNAGLLVNSAITDFECALAEYIVASGLVGDELLDSSPWWFQWDYDRRSFSRSGLLTGSYQFNTCDQSERMGVYIPLSTARWQADHALELLQGWSASEVVQRDSLIATAAAYAGYSYILIGEGMCTAAFDLGPELQPAAVFGLARERFSLAIQSAESADAGGILNLARVGWARASHRLGQLEEAAEQAALVPSGFSFNATYSSASPRSENKVYTMNVRLGDISVEDDYRGMSFGGVLDPRVDVMDSGQLGLDGVSELWYQMKYTSATAPIPIATAEEARLIEAEAALGRGDLANSASIISGLHAAVGLPPFTSSDAEEIRQQLMYERSAALFLDSHHLGDVRQYELALTPAPGAPFPEKAGGVYGSQTCFPLPEVEYQNNPNVDG